MVRQSPGVKRVQVMVSPLPFKRAKAGAKVGGNMRAQVGVDMHAQGAHMRVEVGDDQYFSDNADVEVPMPQAINVDFEDKSDSSSNDDASSASESESI